MLLTLATYIPVITGLGLIGLFVILTKRTFQHYIFAALLFSGASWQLMQFFAEILAYNNTAALFLVRLGSLLGYISASLIYVFIRSFTRKKLINYVTIFLGLGFLFFTVFSFTDLLIENIKATGAGIAVEAGPLYGIQTALLGLALLFGFVELTISTLALSKRYRGKNYLLAIAFAVPVISNIIIAFFYADSTFAQIISPLSIVFMAGMIFYAIVQHQLFDIRFIVARSVAYISSLVLLSIIYAVVSYFLISKLIFTNNTVDSSQIALYTGMAVATSLVFPYLKSLFDRLTNTIFFRNAYDSEQILSELGKILANQIDLEPVVHSSLTLLITRLKISYAKVIVFDENNKFFRTIIANTDNSRHPSSAEFDSFSGNQITLRDHLELRSKRKKILDKYNVDMIGKLETADSLVGYMILGPKQAGSTYSSQDVKLLEISLKQMAIAVQNARYFAQIAEFNETLQVKIKQATAKLENTNEKLKELDSAKDEFISMASHQLRTPLTTIKGYLSMVLEGDVGKLNKDQHQYVDQAFGSAQRMVYLIADLLNVSRLNTGKFVIDKTETNLAEVVQQEIDQLQRHAATRNIELSYKKPAKFPIVNMDETKTRQVIMNFTDNALYYTPEGGKVKVTLKETTTAIEFTVTDTGIGVPKSLQHKLFSKFYRADNAKQARPDGTGLGLFMAKKVIVAQGGAVIFSSKEGVGSTFGFSFPKSKILVKPKK